MKVDIYNIFNEIQTDTNTKDNLTKLIGFFEKKKTKEFIEIIEQVILMIYKYHDKNNAALKNIKDFLKRFLEKIIKIQKLKNENIEFIEYFCNLFTQNTKKNSIKELSLIFLSKNKYI